MRRPSSPGPGLSLLSAPAHSQPSPQGEPCTARLLLQLLVSHHLRAFGGECGVRSHVDPARTRLALLRGSTASDVGCFPRPAAARGLLPPPLWPVLLGLCGQLLLHPDSACTAFKVASWRPFSVHGLTSEHGPFPWVKFIPASHHMSGADPSHPQDTSR